MIPDKIAFFGGRVFKKVQESCSLSVKIICKKYFGIYVLPKGEKVVTLREL
ncbi:hypothetical protein PU02_0791 [Bartonella ancashensis]|uniref:Uncharacterized protein n=1 Tax=Bartonella ancashensis TaxID=1318743 RepID=A0A0M3T2Z8_9HYPH|nr:hypothetical protein PU02_0791 [Bartonella ancashensis]